MGTWIHSSILWLRYLLIIPAAIGGWFTAFFIGLEIESLRTQRLCPPEFLENNTCYADNWISTPLWLMVSSVALSAVLTLTFSTLMAPRHRPIIANFIYVCASLIALFLAYHLGDLEGWILAISAMISGAIALRFIHKKTARNTKAKHDSNP